MASASTAVVARSTASALDGVKAPGQQSLTPQCISPPSLPLTPTSNQQNRKISKATAFYHRMRNVAAMATGESMVTVESPAEPTTETPEFVKTLQDTAIDRLPLVPGVLELVGIGYTGWFAYRNIAFKPDREALLTKIRSTYDDIIGGGGS
ncbi:hypothetical protein QJS04_geneDACA021824 [Acorus gramineus]|uniref:Cyanobacterial aminoacyl-tRNA synthetase CAAD domain-containing protein n=1 Tax=Acorus gramineus TaxID=55184 RepID=A0AAV9ABM8_ACOGR|nr:hypothetical protein QJS04_geneDACA021824 [Acorus gramineus]